MLCMITRMSQSSHKAILKEPNTYIHTHMYVYLCVIYVTLKQEHLYRYQFWQALLTSCVLSRSCGRNLVLKQPGNVVHTHRRTPTLTLGVHNKWAPRSCWSAASDPVLGVPRELGGYLLPQAKSTTIYEVFLSLLFTLRLSAHANVWIEFDLQAVDAGITKSSNWPLAQHFTPFPKGTK